LTRERVRELAMAIAAANGVLRVEMYRGKRYEDIEHDYQAAVREFDEALKSLDCD
jgi:hypothetical protein